MKKLLAVILLLLGSLTGTAQTTELIIIGNVHAPMPHYNADSLLAILNRLQPDIILHEIDSAGFTPGNQFRVLTTENEQNATRRYRLQHPGVKVGPFEFEGRNAYRLARGIKQSDEPTARLLDSLYRSGQLSPQQAAVVREYNRLTDSLTSIGGRTAVHFNNARTDSFARLRQYYQHDKIRGVVNERQEFARRFVTTANGERISLREGYNRQCAFWDLRNQTMARNILRVVDGNPGKRIVVLTGFFHRYYLLAELKALKGNRNFVQREFYE